MPAGLIPLLLTTAEKKERKMPVPPFSYKCPFCESPIKEHSCRVVLKARLYEMKSAGDQLLADLVEVCDMYREDVAFSVGARQWEKVNRRK
jgi:hypothetical protein